ncbi:unnamed protein product [Moneuplotes crassus]|uniref:Uncharacterized protein n=1 Tax=Euplotes crassus TaxID=5936 RepID=A0AAD2CZP4_EUPCR|nr:unnamed protein product [Moneuplotes crassus]
MEKQTDIPLLPLKNSESKTTKNCLDQIESFIKEKNTTCKKFDSHLNPLSVLHFFNILNTVVIPQILQEADEILASQNCVTKILNSLISVINLRSSYLEQMHKIILIREAEESRHVRDLVLSTIRADIRDESLQASLEDLLQTLTVKYEEMVFTKNISRCTYDETLNCKESRNLSTYESSRLISIESCNLTPRNVEFENYEESKQPQDSDRDIQELIEIKENNETLSSIEQEPEGGIWMITSLMSFVLMLGKLIVFAPFLILGLLIKLCFRICFKIPYQTAKYITQKVFCCNRKGCELKDSKKCQN